MGFFRRSNKTNNKFDRESEDFLKRVRHERSFIDSIVDDINNKVIPEFKQLLDFVEPGVLPKYQKAFDVIRDYILSYKTPYFYSVEDVDIELLNLKDLRFILLYMSNMSMDMYYENQVLEDIIKKIENGISSFNFNSFGGLDTNTYEKVSEIFDNLEIKISEPEDEDDDEFVFEASFEPEDASDEFRNLLRHNFIASWACKDFYDGDEETITKNLNSTKKFVEDFSETIPFYSTYMGTFESINYIYDSIEATGSFEDEDAFAMIVLLDQLLILGKEIYNIMEEAGFEDDVIMYTLQTPYLINISLSGNVLHSIIISDKSSFENISFKDDIPGLKESIVERCGVNSYEELNFVISTSEFINLFKPLNQKYTIPRAYIVDIVKADSQDEIDTVLQECFLKED